MAAALIGASATAYANTYSEGAVTSGSYTYAPSAGKGANGTCVDASCTSYATPNDFSSNGLAPTNIGTLGRGDNFITGAITSYGSIYNPDGTLVGPNHELTNQDMDYITFNVPNGYVLANFLVGSGTSIATTPRVDSLFLGLASTSTISVPYGPTANSAVGLLGWTLVTQSLVGTDILPAIGAANPPNFPAYLFPGATTFKGPLGAGTYTLWLYDGDAGASYNFDAVVAPVPEPATWAMMIVGFGVIGFGLRRRSRQPVRVTYA